jgi:hypothetical protein
MPAPYKRRSRRCDAGDGLRAVGACPDSAGIYRRRLVKKNEASAGADNPAERPAPAFRPCPFTVLGAAQSLAKLLAGAVHRLRRCPSLLASVCKEFLTNGS